MIELTERLQKLEEVQTEVRENIVHEQMKMKNRYDRKHFDGIQYEVGEVVVMPRPTGLRRANRRNCKPSIVKNRYKG